MIRLRKEESGDSQEIGIVIQNALGQTEEADLVDGLRRDCPSRLSFVSVSEEQMVGQILFTPVTIESKERIMTGMGLGPMAVLPEFQRRGINSPFYVDNDSVLPPADSLSLMIRSVSSRNDFLKFRRGDHPDPTAPEHEGLWQKDSLPLDIQSLFSYSYLTENK